MLGTPKFGARSFISERINNLAYNATKYPPKTNNPKDDIPQQQGSFNECMFYLIAQQCIPNELIEFDEEKAWKQFLYGRDGKPDVWDAVVNGKTVDVKYDSKMANSGKICFEIRNSKGQPTLLLNGKVDYSAHMSYFERNLPNAFQNKNKGLHLVIVDLNSLRDYLREDSGTYYIGDWESRETYYKTICIDVPISYLTDSIKVADKYTY